MSNATPGAAATYTVTFKPASTTAIDGVILEFCDNDPIIADTCNAPTGLNVGTPTVAFTSHVAGNPVVTTALPGTWGTPAAATAHTLKFATSSGDSGALDPATLYSFDVTTMTNPTATTGQTFYARLITYTANGAGSDYANYTATNPGDTTALDYGGFALSTSQNVNITTRVQETLTFCTSGTFNTANDSTQLLDPMDGTNTAINANGQTGGSDCTAATTPDLTIGHGSPTAVIDNSQVDASLAFMQASTNATNGMTIRMKATNTCTNGGLSSTGGANCSINGVGGTTPATGVPGTTFFGLFVSPSTTTSGVATSTGTLVPDPNYNGGACTIALVNTTCKFGMDDSATSGVISTYGDVIASSAVADGGTGPISQLNSKLLFGATAGLTVPAGIYTGSESLIATGTF
ncbi:MAG TPA: hypothetical protein VFH39_02905 [Candidatus Saccharimonadales bacterium]|nr:hypothetical protein [Candidatus Saccharimonadales bacterium]